MDDKYSREWDEASQPWADFVRKGKDYYRDEMNNPAALSLIGEIKGKLLLDLSCGEGHNTRILARKGATVTGVDLSRALIDLARESEKTDRLGIRYLVSDAADLGGLGSGQFDLVTCFMALMDIEHYEGAISQVARVLKKNGRFVFSITHPCFGDTAENSPFAAWKCSEEASKGSCESPWYLEVRRYFGTSKYEVKWDMRRLTKPFKTTSFHRTLTDYFQALQESGFAVTRLVEPKPTPKGVSEYPSLGLHMLIPHSIVIEALKK